MQHPHRNLQFVYILFSYNPVIFVYIVKWIEAKEINKSFTLQVSQMRHLCAYNMGPTHKAPNKNHLTQSVRWFFILSKGRNKMGYAKYTEDDNEIRMERYRKFDYIPYYSEYYNPLPEEKQPHKQGYINQEENYFYTNKEE